MHEEGSKAMTQTAFKTRHGTRPRVFSLENGDIRYVVEGTDGCLYEVPVEALGWLQRVKYGGPVELLRPLVPPVAAGIARFVGGTIGPVRVAGL
jgi:hypothetical protein